jgi:hypothetical protein
MKKACLMLSVFVVILWGSCATTSQTAGTSQVRGGMPGEMTSWINQHQDDVIYGVGISSIGDESDALREATALARSDLAGNVETDVATITADMVKRAEGRGETERIAKFEDATKQVINQTISYSKTYGPYVNNIGNTYIIKYIDKQGFRRDLSSYVDEAFKDVENDLDKILGLN